MAPMDWIVIAIVATIVLAVIVIPLIGIIAEELDNTPRRRAARITRRISDTRSEVSGIFAAARDAMDRRTGRADSFRLGGSDRW